MIRHALLVVAALSFIAPGCATGQDARTGGKVVLLSPDESPEDFELRRSTVDDALARGPSWFIQQVAVRSVVLEGRFYGFQIHRLFPDVPGFSSRTIRVGDIVQRINGHSIETPGGFMHAWDSVKDADVLSIRLVRGGRPLQVTWTIVDDGASEGATAAATSARP